MVNLSPDMNTKAWWKSGYGGDEDQEQAGGLAAMMAIGLFQMRGAAIDPVYEITSPVFDKLTIALDDKYYPGKHFEISTENNTAANTYVQSRQDSNL